VIGVDIDPAVRTLAGSADPGDEGPNRGHHAAARGDGHGAATDGGQSVPGHRPPLTTGWSTTTDLEEAQCAS